MGCGISKTAQASVRDSPPPTEGILHDKKVADTKKASDGNLAIESKPAKQHTVENKATASESKDDKAKHNEQSSVPITPKSPVLTPGSSTVVEPTPKELPPLKDTARIKALESNHPDPSTPRQNGVMKPPLTGGGLAASSNSVFNNRQHLNSSSAASVERPFSANSIKKGRVSDLKLEALGKLVKLEITNKLEEFPAETQARVSISLNLKGSGLMDWKMMLDQEVKLEEETKTRMSPYTQSSGTNSFLVPTTQELNEISKRASTFMAPAQPIQPKVVDVKQELDALWEQADDDGNGYLDMEEFIEILTSEKLDLGLSADEIKALREKVLSNQETEGGTPVLTKELFSEVAEQIILLKS
eukprot:Colp12_sorted_trinity150504_noHs@31283